MCASLWRINNNEDAMPEAGHDLENAPRTAVLLVNLGTPASPAPRDVGRYLREFLSDPRVVDLPRWLWLPLLNLVIIPLRSRRSAAAYRKVWLNEGSPLLVYSHRLANRLAEKLQGSASVALAMRYGKPSVADTLRKMQADGIRKLVVLPLYPQYSRTTTASVFDAVDSALGELAWQPQQVRIEDYHQHSPWIAAVADSIRQFRSVHGKADRLMFSLHGIPQRYVQNGDPYAQHCSDSVAAIARQAGLGEGEWLLCYQSRVGREAWLQPYTDISLQQLAAEGVQQVQVVSPGFAVDCLETLEEIAIRYDELFSKNGGTKLDYIPALNDSDAHVQALASLLDPHL
jgi:ferrochelatase